MQAQAQAQAQALVQVQVRVQALALMVAATRVLIPMSASFLVSQKAPKSLALDPSSADQMRLPPLHPVSGPRPQLSGYRPSLQRRQRYLPAACTELRRSSG